MESFKLITVFFFALFQIILGFVSWYFLMRGGIQILMTSDINALNPSEMFILGCIGLFLWNAARGFVEGIQKNYLK